MRHYFFIVMIQEHSMASSPMLSVLMPVYKVSTDYLDLAIESILNQTHRAFEFIIISDGAPQEVVNRLKFWEKNQDLGKVREITKKTLANLVYFIMPSCQGKFHPFGTSVRRVTHPAAYELCNSGTTSCTTRHAPVAQLVFPAFPSTRIYLPDKDKVTFRKVFTDKSLSLQSQL